MANHSSDLGLTTVDEEFTASDVTAFVGGKERDRFGDLIRGSRSAQRNRRCDGLDVIIHLLLRQTKAGVISRCRNDARTDRVDADALALQVHGPIAGKRAERRFGGTIDAEGRVSLKYTCGREVLVNVGGFIGRAPYRDIDALLRVVQLLLTIQ